MTPEQRELLQDKLSAWREQSERGPMDFRDYNRRCADALADALLRIRELEGHVRTLELQQQTDRATIAAAVRDNVREEIRPEVEYALKLARVSE